MIPENFHQENQLQSTLDKFFQEFRISSMLTKANCRKDAGVPVSIIFRLLFSLLFYGKSLPRSLSSGLFPEAGGKDVVYRFLNSYRTNWRKFLWLLSSSVILKVVWPLTGHDRQAVLIVDDSLFKRARSKKVELLSRVHDHTTNSYVRGFRMLTLGWSDGNSFIPLAFSLLSSSNPKNRFAEATTSLDKRTIGHKRRCEAVMKSPDVLISLLRQVKTLGIPGCHVLFDSWFSSPVLLARIYSLGYKAVAMLKKTPKVFYRYNGKLLTLSQLFAVVKKRRGRAKILASISVELSSKTEAGEPVVARIVFVRDRHKPQEWLALITTDTALSEDEIVRLYGKRWDIEVFFKVIKSYLKLAKEWQSRSYDAMVAHTTIVFSRYIMLAVEQRRATDSRSAGGIFYDCCEELVDLQFSQALALVMNCLRQVLQTLSFMTEADFSVLWQRFIDSLPSILKERLAFSRCET